MLINSKETPSMAEPPKYKVRVIGRVTYDKLRTRLCRSICPVSEESPLKKAIKRRIWRLKWDLQIILMTYKNWFSKATIIKEQAQFTNMPPLSILRQWAHKWHPRWGLKGSSSKMEAPKWDQNNKSANHNNNKQIITIIVWKLLSTRRVWKSHSDQ
jgi:hypothetical protein